MYYRQETMDGVNEKAPHYHMIYVKLVNNYLIFSRNICTSSVELYKYILPLITNHFFPFNLINYSCSLVYYHNNLMRIDETHPDLNEQLSKGFGMKRTNKPFSIQAIDFTVEKIYDNKAAKRLAEIMPLTNSTDARQRWSKSRGIRCTIISYILDETGQTKKQNTTADLQDSRIKKLFSVEKVY